MIDACSFFSSSLDSTEFKLLESPSSEKLKLATPRGGVPVGVKPPVGVKHPLGVWSCGTFLV